MANRMNKFLGHLAGDDKRFNKNGNQAEKEDFVEDMLE